MSLEAVFRRSRGWMILGEMPQPAGTCRLRVDARRNADFAIVGIEKMMLDTGYSMRALRAERRLGSMPYRASSIDHHFHMNSSNIDPEELAKFEALGPDLVGPRGAFRALHDINHLRIGYINGRVPLAGRKVLDLGCGGGSCPKPWRPWAPRSPGSTPARSRSRWQGFTSRNPGCGGLPAGDSGIICGPRAGELRYRHLHGAAGACPQAGIDRGGLRPAWSKPSGDVFFATLNRNLKSFLFAIVGAEIILRLVQRGTHSYRRFVKPLELRDWAGRSGLEIQDRMGYTTTRSPAGIHSAAIRM